jgi:hypothetical protein
VPDFSLCEKVGRITCCAAEAPPVADAARRLAAAATRQLPSKQRLAMEMPFVAKGIDQPFQLCTIFKER